MIKLKLCYVNEPWAFFTSQSLDDQWDNKAVAQTASNILALIDKECGNG